MSNVLEIKGITKYFPSSSGKITALNDINLNIEKGSCNVIAGANGSGKSVLMSIIARLSKPSSGKIIYDDSCSIGLVFQEADTQILGETPFEDVMFGPRNLGLSKKECEERTLRALDSVGLLSKKDSSARFLSGGEKRRLAVASILSMHKDLIIFDEPYANLDYESVKQVNSLIFDLLSQKKTVIILTHEIEKCLKLANHFVVIYQGSIVFDGTPDKGLEQNLEKWSIRNPLVTYKSKEDLIWI